MAVPLLDLTRQYTAIQSEIEEAALRLMRSGHYVLGEEVEALEKELAEYLGAPHVVGLSSGTDALLVALMALGTAPGDRVLVPVYSFFATAGVVARLDAIPVFVDVEPTWNNMDPDALRRVLDTEEDVKAAMFVHLYGAGAGVKPVAQVLEDRGIPLIEDAAQAIGTRVGGQPAGSFGLCGCFSTFPTKNLGGIGDGGFLCTLDGDLAAWVRRLRNHGQTDAYRHAIVGGNFRLDALQAAVLRVKLRHLEEWIDARRSNAQRYRELFHEKLPGAVKVPTDIEDRHAYHQFVIEVDPDRRDDVIAGLREKQIGCSIYYPLPFHQQPCFERLGYLSGDFPVAEHASRSGIALPIFPELRADEQVEVVDAVAGALQA